MKSFNRSHLNSCQILPADFFSLQNDARFIKDVAEIANGITLKPQKNQQEFNYTPLDYLLNEKRYEDYTKALTHLDAILIRKTADTRL